ncbi:TadE family protein [Methylotenera mobilis JLW8]|uniref:TadE family protein n=2 Tax=Methylotenera mobilis TaxID=359408 RepID=C6WWK3_METML|nr:TadE family protein [Methylotenera mobilis JLW8]
MMLKMMKSYSKRQRQQGAAAVEFAIIALLLFTILFGILEFGRLFYVYNTVQEVTRHAAREAVVRWVDNSNTSPAKILALFGGASVPAGAEITAANIDIQYLTASGAVPSPFPLSASDNISACLTGPAGCIALVQVSIIGANYAPMVGLFPFLNLPIPASTVTMPAESLGYTGS